MEARVAAARAASNRGALPSASMRVKEDAVKAAQLLHDPSKTHELYANEREGRAAGGGGGRERRRRDDASATAAAAAGSWRSRPRTASACTSR